MASRPPPLPPGFVVQQSGAPAAAAPPPVPQQPRPVVAIGRAPPAPPSGYRDNGANLTAIPGGPADPSRSPPSGYRFTAGGGLEAIPGGPADPERNNPHPSGDVARSGPEYLASIPDPARRAQVQAMLEGRIPYPTGRALTDPHWMQIIADTVQTDPGYDAATALRRRQAITQFTGNGQAAQRIASANRLAHHIDDLSNASDALVGPNTGFTPANTALAAVGQTFEPSARATYDNAVGQVANELERYFRGAGGSEHDVDRIISGLSRYQSHDERTAAIREVISLIHGGLGPLQDQYNSAFQTATSRPQLPWIDPAAESIYRRLGTDFGLTGEDQNRQQQGAAVAATPGGGAAPPATPAPSGQPAAPGDPPPAAPNGGEDVRGALSEAPAGSTARFELLQRIVNDPHADQVSIGMAPDRRGLATEEEVRNGRAVFTNRYSLSEDEMRQVRAEYQAELPARQRAAEIDRTVGPMGRGDQFQHGAMMSLGDEAAGVGGALENIIGSPFTGNFDPVGAYTTERDADRIRLQEAEDANGFTGHAASFLGGLASARPGVNMLVNPTFRQALTEGVRSGAAVGAIGSFGQGRGLNDSLVGAIEGGAGGAVIGAAVPTVGAGFNALVGGRQAAAAGRNELVAAAQRQEVPLTRLEAGGTGSRMAGGVIGMTPGEIPLVQGTQRSVAGSLAARDRIAGTLGTVAADETSAGNAAQAGIRDFKANSADRRTQLFNRVPIPANGPAATSGTVSALQDRLAGMQSNQPLSEMFHDQRLQGYLDAIQGKQAQVPTGILDAQGNPITRTVQQGGGLNYGDMRRFRSLVGEMVDQPTMAGDGSSKAALRQLYAGLSQDLQTTAASTSPRALALMNRAIQYDRGRHARLEGLVTDILGDRGDKNPLAAYEQINRWARATGGDPNRLGQALRSMPDEEANTVRASIFSRMGQAKPARQDAVGEVFSPAEFATNWNNLSERARGFLFPDAQHRADINDLVNITTAQKRSSQYTNFSRTALGANAVAFFEGMTHAPIPTLAAALGSYGAGKLLASPAGARWAIRATTASNPRLFIQALSEVGRRSPVIAQQAASLRQRLLGVANDNAQAGSLAAQSPDQGPDNANPQPR